MATGLQTLRTAAGIVTNLFNMKMAKLTAAGARPRGNDHNRYHLDSRQNQHLRTCPHLTFTFIPSCIVLSFLGAGRLLDHQRAIQEGDISYISRHFDESHFSKQTHSQYSDFAVLLGFSLLALLACVSSRTITALAQGSSRDQRLPQSPIVHHREQSCAEDWVFLLKRTSKTTITCLSYLATGLLTVILLTSSRIHCKEADFCPAGTQHIQQLHQSLKKADLRLLAAILIAPSSSYLSTLEKIVDYPIPVFKIGDTLKMDSRHLHHGIYRPITDRMAEDEALTLRDSESEAAEKSASLNAVKEDFSKDTAPSSARPTVTWAPDPDTNPPNPWSQTRMQSRRREEADGVTSIGNSFNVRSSSLNTASQVQNTAWDLGSGYPNIQEPRNNPSSGGPLRSAIRKTRSSIFKHTSSQEDAEIPPMPKQSLVSRATNNIFRSNASRKDHAPGVAGRSISNPETQGPTGVMVLRNLEMEEKAKAMGFTLSPNRFGFQEKVIGDGGLPMESPSEVSSTAGTIGDPVISEDESEYTDDDTTVFGEGVTEAISENQELPTPPLAANTFNPENEGGLDGLEESHSDHMAWLKNCFTPPKTDLLKDFGTPSQFEAHSPRSDPVFKMGDETHDGLHNLDAPQIEAHPTHSDPAFKVGDDTRNRLHNLDAPPMIGKFGTSEAEVVPIFGPNYPQTDNGHSREAAKLRGEIRMLVEKFLAKDSEFRSIKARELAALARIEVLENLLEYYGIPLEAAEKNLGNVDVFDLATNSAGAYQTPTKSGLSSSSKGSFGDVSGGNRSSHKKSKSQESGFFKSLRGTTEPSLVAFEKFKERSLLDANADEKDPDLPAKLKVSSRQLPPDAPKTASKEPVPKSKNGASNMLRKLSSLDNLKRKDAKVAGSSDSKYDLGGNASQNSHSSQSKDASLISITEEYTGGSKSAETSSGPPSRREKVTSFSEDSSLPANHQRHSRSSGALTGQYGSDLSLALANLTTDKPQEKGSGAIPPGWEYMGSPKGCREEECDEVQCSEEDFESPTGESLLSRATFNSSKGAFAYEDRAVFDEDRGERGLRSNPPSRSPPARPGHPAYSPEHHQGFSGKHEALEEQPRKAWPPTTPERFNVNKSLPEIIAEDVDKEYGRKDGKKRGLRNLFTRK